MTFTLREDDRQPTPPPPKGAGFRHSPLGQLPHPPGQLLMHESEVDDLAPFGWQPGDPVPPDFADKLTAARKEVEADIRSGRFEDEQGNPTAGPPPLRMPKEIPVSMLPPAKQQELADMLREYKDVAPQLRAAQADQMRLSELEPSVQNAIRQAMQADNVDDGEKVAGGAESPPAEEGDHERTEEPTGQCPHCLRDLTTKPPEPEPDDLINFVGAILGQQRFIKRYEFLGGRLAVVLRQPTSAEASLLAEQVSTDQRDGRILNMEDMLRLGFGYRLVLSLQTVHLGGRAIDVGKAVDAEIQRPGVAGAENTSLPRLLTTIQKKPPFDNEGVWNMLLQAGRQFGELTKILQDRADKPDFWKAIEN